MPSLLFILGSISAAAFFFYGVTCLVSRHMAAEFARYGLAHRRVLVGSLEVAGAAGLVAGHFIPPVGVAAAAGLALLMACGLWARWRIRDPWYALLPAFVLGVVNALIAWLALAR